MKIALINTLYYPFQVGGAEKSVQLLAEGFLQEGHDVFIISLNPPKEDLKIDHVHGVRVYRVPLYNQYWPFEDFHRKPHLSLRLLWHLRDRNNWRMGHHVFQILKEEAPDLVHTHNLVGFSVSAWTSAKKLGLPVIHTLRDYSLLCPKGMYKNGYNCSKQCGACKILSNGRKRLSHHVDSVIGVGQYTLSRHIQSGFFSLSKQDVVYNAAPHSGESFVKNSQKQKGLFTIGFLGRLAPNKGVEDLIKAVERLKGKVPIKLIIAGSGNKDYEEALVQQADGLPVQFLGYVPPEKLFQDIDCLVVTSRWHEPFPRVIIESFTYMTPVIGTTRGGIPEIIKEGEVGWLYDPDVPGDLERAIIEAYDALHYTDEKMYTRMREIVQDLSVENHVKRYVTQYRRLIGEK